jgi:hypothetical protein
MLNRIAAVVLLVIGSATVALASTVTPPIPEPSVLALLASGAGAAVLYARNRRPRK